MDYDTGKMFEEVVLRLQKIQDKLDALTKESQQNEEGENEEEKEEPTKQQEPLKVMKKKSFFGR